MSALPQVGPERSRRRYVHTGIREGRIVLLKECAHCGKEGVCSDGPESDFWPRKRDAAGHAVRFGSYCKSCSTQAVLERRNAKREEVLAKRRAYHREKMEHDSEYRARHQERCREGRARWLAVPENQEKARASHREAAARRRAEDPEAVNEDQRFYYALRQERKGKPVRQVRAVVYNSWPRVDAHPFRVWLEAWRKAEGVFELEVVARTLGIPPARVRRVLAGQRSVALDVVDRALQNSRRVVQLDGRLVLTLDDLYQP